MISLGEKLRTIPWHIVPSHWYELDIRSKAAPAERDDKDEPVAARPNRTVWGDPIPQMVLRPGTSGMTAMIPIQGALVKGATGSQKRYYGVSSHEDIHEDITSAVSKDVKSILFTVNSPGGSVLGTEGLARRIQDLAERGICVGMYTHDQCCSAAEFITAGCYYRMCSPDSITGSIGTMMQVVTAQKLYEDFGLEFNLFASGPYKGMGSMGKSLTPVQKEFLQGFIDARAKEFKGFMTANRPRVKPETMQGQIFTGRDAVKNGLYDLNVGSVDEALAVMGAD